MPELPEVETVRAGIADHSLGHPVRAVRVVDARSLRRHLPGPAHFEAALTGRALRGAYRRGKYLWLTWTMTRTVGGRGQRKRSRFLDDIDPAKRRRRAEGAGSSYSQARSTQPRATQPRRSSRGRGDYGSAF